MWQRHLFAGPKPLSKKDLAVAEYFATGVKKWQRHLAKSLHQQGKTETRFLGRTPLPSKKGPNPRQRRKPRVEALCYPRYLRFQRA